MTLTSGTRLGAFEVLSPLGKGGMGEVWRALDSRLGREVAIKLLLEEVANDAERLARFEREARVKPLLTTSARRAISSTCLPRWRTAYRNRLVTVDRAGNRSPTACPEGPIWNVDATTDGAVAYLLP